METLTLQNRKLLASKKARKQRISLGGVFILLVAVVFDLVQLAFALLYTGLFIIPGVPAFLWAISIALGWLGYLTCGTLLAFQKNGVVAMFKSIGFGFAMIVADSVPFFNGVVPGLTLWTWRTLRHVKRESSAHIVA